MFVEDSVGTVCQVLLSEKTLGKLCVDLASLEGHTVKFSGLTVQDRLTRDK